MALAVIHADGATDIGAANAPAWTSTAGSLIVVIYLGYDDVATPAGTDVTDNFGNTYSVAVGAYHQTAQFGGGVIYYQLGGTRGASHAITWDYGIAGASDCIIGVLEITGHDTSTPFDTTTDATALDGVSPYNITAGAAILGNQIAVYGCVTDAFTNTAWTPPGGYTNIYNEPNGTTHAVCGTFYKINETGTPTVGATRGEVTTDAFEVFATFKEAGAVSGPVVAWLKA